MALDRGDTGGSSTYVPEADRSAALSGGGGRFQVDPAQVTTLTSGISDAIDKLDTLNQVINRLASISPPGGDPFSANAVDQFGQTASGGPAALLEMHKKYRELLVQTRDQVAKDNVAFQAQDGASGASFSGGA